MADYTVFLDEDVPLQLVSILKASGITAHTAQEIGALAAADAVHLRTCVDRGWILVTQNCKHFQRLHWLWMTFNYWGVLPQPHAGIITIREQEPTQPNEWSPAIIQLLKDQGDFHGLMFMWRPSNGQWEPQPPQFA